MGLIEGGGYGNIAGWTLTARLLLSSPLAPPPIRACWQAPDQVNALAGWTAPAMMALNGRGRKELYAVDEGPRPWAVDFSWQESPIEGNGGRVTAHGPPGGGGDPLEQHPAFSKTQSARPSPTRSGNFPPSLGRNLNKGVAKKA